MRWWWCAVLRCLAGWLGTRLRGWIQSENKASIIHLSLLGRDWMEGTGAELDRGRGWGRNREEFPCCFNWINPDRRYLARSPTHAHTRIKLGARWCTSVIKFRDRRSSGTLVVSQEAGESVCMRKAVPTVNWLCQWLPSLDYHQEATGRRRSEGSNLLKFLMKTEVNHNPLMVQTPTTTRW